MTNSVELLAAISKSRIDIQEIASVLKMTIKQLDRRVLGIVEFNVVEMYLLIELLKIENIESVFFAHIGD